MSGVFRYLLDHYHVLGILLIVTVIAVKLFMSTHRARKMLSRFQECPKVDEITARLDRIEQLLQPGGQPENGRYAEK